MISSLVTGLVYMRTKISAQGMSCTIHIFTTYSFSTWPCPFASLTNVGSLVGDLARIIFFFFKDPFFSTVMYEAVYNYRKPPIILSGSVKLVMSGVSIAPIGGSRGQVGENIHS